VAFYVVAGSSEISNSLKRDLLDIGELYDLIKSKEEVIMIVLCMRILLYKEDDYN